MFPRTRWGVRLRSDCPLCVLHCVKSLKHTPYVPLHVHVCVSARKSECTHMHLQYVSIVVWYNHYWKSIRMSINSRSIQSLLGFPFSDWNSAFTIMGIIWYKFPQRIAFLKNQSVLANYWARLQDLNIILVKQKRTTSWGLKIRESSWVHPPERKSISSLTHQYLHPLPVLLTCPLPPPPPFLFPFPSIALIFHVEIWFLPLLLFTPLHSFPFYFSVLWSSSCIFSKQNSFKSPD